MNMLFGLLLIVVLLAVLVMFLVVALSAGPSTNEKEFPQASQNKNVNGGIRHPYKDINSY